jgi:ribonucleoside-diphosphate reductase alpha chain
MALKGSTSRKQAAAEAMAEPATALAAKEAGLPFDAAGDLRPVKLPEIMSCLRVRQMTPFGNMHVKVSVDPISGREREVFAQLGKGGDVANSDLEAICRILSLWLRCNGRLSTALKQLEGIGSSLTVPTKDGRIMSLGDGLAKALQRYLDAKESHGLHSLLLGTAPQDLQKSDIFTAEEVAQVRTASRPRNVSQYKIKCPACAGELAFQEGCVKCHGCGFSQC